MNSNQTPKGKTRTIFHSRSWDVPCAWDVLDEQNRYVVSVYDDTDRGDVDAPFSVYAMREDDIDVLKLAGNFESELLAWRFVADELERRGYEFESPVNICKACNGTGTLCGINCPECNEQYVEISTSPYGVEGLWG